MLCTIFIEAKQGSKAALEILLILLDSFGLPLPVESAVMSQSFAESVSLTVCKKYVSVDDNQIIPPPGSFLSFSFQVSQAINMECSTIFKT